MLEESNLLVMIDADGNEKEMHIVLTFEVDEGKKYVLLSDPEDINEDVYPYAYDDSGNLYVVEDPAEFAMCEEVLNTFLDEE